jgi:hypothetical protein
MSSVPTYDCFIFVIKTDLYAGNFEQEMCAYMTGECGECGVGDKEAGLFISEYPGNKEFENLVISFPDDNGYYHPSTIWGVNCRDVAIFFESSPTSAQLDLMRDRARKFAEITDPYDGKHKHISIRGFELIEYCAKHTESLVSKWKKNQ